MTESAWHCLPLILAAVIVSGVFFAFLKERAVEVADERRKKETGMLIDGHNRALESSRKDYAEEVQKLERALKHSLDKGEALKEELQPLRAREEMRIPLKFDFTRGNRGRWRWNAYRRLEDGKMRIAVKCGVSGFATRKEAEDDAKALMVGWDTDKIL